MRSHAKAASAGSSTRRTGADRIVRGELIRGGSGDSDGSGASSQRLRFPAFVLFVLLAGLLFTAAPALAVKTHPYTGTSFGPDGTTATSFGNTQGLTVDQTTGDVYVYEVSNGGKVYKFDAAGNPVNFSALGTNVITGVGGAGGGEEELAIAPPGSPGGTAGDLYVSNNFAIKVYSPAGTELGQLSGGETCGVATNPAGHVFVGVYPNTVREYVPAANPVTNANESGASSAGLPGICNVAADGLGNVYAANYSGGSIAKLEGLSAASVTTIEPGASTLAIDPSNNDLYANRGSAIAQYSSAGALIGTFGSGLLSSSHGIGVNGASQKIYVNGADGKVVVYGPEVVVPTVTANAASDIHATRATLSGAVNPDGLAVTNCVFEYGTDTSYGSTVPCEGAIPTDSSDHAVSAEITGLAPGATYHFRVAATNANGTNYSSDKTFESLAVATTKPASSISGTKATLNGIVSPRGEAVTECKFEYGTEFPLTNSIPCEGSIPTDENPHPVTAALTHLVPNGTNYIFRLVVVRASGTAQGSNQSFQTGPTVFTEPASAIRGTKATLNGIVSPEGEAVTECKFEYGTEFPLTNSIPCEGSIPTDENPHPVTAALTHLVPNGTNYIFRLVVVQASGTGQGSNEGFRTANTVITGAASALTETSATLNGTLNPEGIEYTECKFEYGATESYGSSVPCAESAATIGTGSTPVSVHADISGLSLGTNYHYRLIATNADGTANGADRSFTTLGPPVVSGELASSIASATAKLNGAINPTGELTTFHFEYGDQGPCDANPCTSVPVPDETVPDESGGAGFSDTPVSVAINGLQPKTTYHFRLVATNALGTDVGPDVSFTTYESSPVFGSCPNDEFRTGFSAKLPDCRAYEQVSPAEKNGADIGGEAYDVQASVSGDAVTFTTLGGLPAEGNGVGTFPKYIAHRVGESWPAQSLLPPPNLGNATNYLGWTPDLKYSLNGPSFFYGEPVAGAALLLHGVADVSNKLIVPYTTEGDGEGKASYSYAGASADDSKLLFEVQNQVLPVDSGAAPTSTDNNLYLYDQDTEELTLVGILPDSACGSQPCVAENGSFAGPYNWWGGGNGFAYPAGLAHGGADQLNYTQDMNVISDSGDKAFFTTEGNGKVYVREGLNTASPHTVQVNASQRGTPDPNGTKAAKFMIATQNGSTAFFTSCQKLTDDSTAVSTALATCANENQGEDLYAFDTTSEELTDLTVDHNGDPKGAQVQGVIGASDNGDYVYFAANGVLASNEGNSGSHASLGDCQKLDDAEGGGYYSGICNIYVWHDGQIEFIAPIEAGLPSGEANSFGGASAWRAAQWGNYATGYEQKTAFVSANGRAMVFLSKLQETAYDTGESRQLYRYQVGEPGVECVSCNPTGAPSDGATLKTSIAEATAGQPSGGNFNPRSISSDGNRVFFQTTSKLVATDVNGDEGCPSVAGTSPACTDVYEWEAQGSGSCHTAGGCIYLISSGTAESPSIFGDASANGDAVFFTTREQLVPADGDKLTDMYVATVDGGLASQHKVSPPPCDLDAGACQGAASVAPNAQGAGTAAFEGPGNPSGSQACPKGKRKLRRHGKALCVKKNGRHQRKVKHPRHHKRDANTNRRASR